MRTGDDPLREGRRVRPLLPLVGAMRTLAEDRADFLQLLLLPLVGGLDRKCSAADHSGCAHRGRNAPRVIRERQGHLHWSGAVTQPVDIDSDAHAPSLSAEHRHLCDAVGSGQGLSAAHQEAVASLRFNSGNQSALSVSFAWKPSGGRDTSADRFSAHETGPSEQELHSAGRDRRRRACFAVPSSRSDDLAPSEGAGHPSAALQIVDSARSRLSFHALLPRPHSGGWPLRTPCQEQGADGSSTHLHCAPRQDPLAHSPTPGHPRFQSRLHLASALNRRGCRVRRASA